MLFIEYKSRLDSTALLIFVVLCFIYSCAGLSSKSDLATDTIKMQTIKQNALYLLSQQNNVSNSANDFVYVTEAGERKRMYSLKARYTLLFFYNPECDACKEYKAMLLRSSIISHQIKNDNLKVLAMYIDKDMALWKRHLPAMPAKWIQGHDQDEYLFKNKVYDLHAIPTIYLLDKNKKVILKDVLSIAVVEDALK